MRLLSVHRLSSAVQLSEHYHDCHQMLYVVRGEIEVSVGEDHYRMQDGSLLIISRFESHAIRVLSRDYERYTLSISPEPSAYGNGDHDVLPSVLVNRSTHFRHVVDTGRRAPAFERLLSMMVDEYRTRAAMRDEMLELYLRHFLTEVYRLTPDLFSADESDSTVMVRTLQARLERDYAEPLTLTALAADCHVSPSHLSHLFKQITGYAPIEYLVACRLSAAKNLLCTTDRPIREIVERCGFTDESNFCRTFRQTTAMTPTEFRRAFGNGHKKAVAPTL